MRQTDPPMANNNKAARCSADENETETQKMPILTRPVVRSGTNYQNKHRQDTRFLLLGLSEDLIRIGSKVDLGRPEVTGIMDADLWGSRQRAA